MTQDGTGVSPGSLPLSVLVADDEPNIVELLATSLKFSGFAVSTAVDGREAFEQGLKNEFDILILDVMMPYFDGFEVIYKLRKLGINTPVIFLTARDSLSDKVRGLTLGADDYLTKPFSLEELVARVHAVSRRVGGVDANSESTINFEDIQMNEQTYTVTKSKATVPLSPTEYKLLRYFLTNPNQVLSKAQILDHVWNYDFSGDANVVESYVSYLRRKLDTQEPRLLHTVRGFGYILKSP